jgi:hypothetical protein
MEYMAHAVARIASYAKACPSETVVQARASVANPTRIAKQGVKWQSAIAPLATYRQMALAEAAKV